MPELREIATEPTDEDEQGRDEVPDADAPLAGLSGATIHVERTGVERVITITELAARTLLTLVMNATAQGSAAKFQLALAEQELEKGLSILYPNGGMPANLSRAQRRAQQRQRKV